MKTWRSLAAAGACVAVLGACGGGGAGPDARPTEASATPTATVSATPEGRFRAALDRLQDRTAVLRAARALAGNRFNASEGTDQDVARKLVQAACADLAEAFTEFDAAVVAVDYPTGSDAEVDAVVNTTRALIDVFGQYATAFEGAEFVEINKVEVTSTKVWERAVSALIAKIGAAPTADPAPTGTA